MKYLNKFDTMSDYQQSASTLETPNVAYITATTEVIYNATAPVQYVTFADPLVEQKCIQLYSSDGIGCTLGDLGAVESLNPNDWAGTNIVSFDELQYFTGLTSLPTLLFSGCSGLRSVVLPPEVTNIQSYAFYNCTSLAGASLDGANRLRYIYSQAFYGCSSLQEIVIPPDVTLIDREAFSRCSSLSRIAFWSDTPPTVETDAFYGLPSTGTILVTAGNGANFNSLAQSIGAGWTVSEW